MTDDKPIKIAWNEFDPANHDSWFDRGFDEAAQIAKLSWISYAGTEVTARYYDGDVFDLVRRAESDDTTETTETLTMTPHERSQFEHMDSLMDDVHVEEGVYHPMGEQCSWFIDQGVLVVEAHRPYHDDERFGFTTTDRQNFRAFAEKARLKFTGDHHSGELNLSPESEPLDELPVFGDPP